MKLGTRKSAAALGAAALLAGGVLASSTAASASSTTAVMSITKLSTSYGSTAGGTTVLITGTGFNRVDPSYRGSVFFGTKAATSFMVLSDTTISATAPAGSGSALQVFVTDKEYTTADSSADDFTYIAPVKVNITPGTELSAAGGTVVTVALSGTGTIGTTKSAFTSNKVTATVDGVAATSLTWVDATHMTLVAPVGIPTRTGIKVPVNVFVHGVAGTADTTNARYDAVVTKLSATTGPTKGIFGSSSSPALTITGVGLTNATGWLFGKTKGYCTTTTAKADTTWTCTNVPSNFTGSVSVLPTFDNGTKAGVLAASTFTYTNL